MCEYTSSEKPYKTLPINGAVIIAARNITIIFGMKDSVASWIWVNA
jgi:hypothetical protein